MLAFPSFKDISEAISSGTLIDCPVTIQSLKRAIDISYETLLNDKEKIRTYSQKKNLLINYILDVIYCAISVHTCTYNNVRTYHAHT